ncbi:hypothetical protein F5Y04DRAFT_64007 [Hypomontagnella monticulosa]|nr:hypothetical protein F5Y04DRAFT_64007 [Hypomontagnella monticulosa]
MKSFWDVVLVKDENQEQSFETGQCHQNMPWHSWDILPDEFRAVKILATLKEADTEDVHTPTHSLASTISVDASMSPTTRSEGSGSPPIEPPQDTWRSKLRPRRHPPTQPAQGATKPIARRDPGVSNLESTDTMDVTTQTEPAKQKARNKANAGNSMKKYLQEIEAKVGPEPPGDASKKVWDSYIFDFMTEVDRKDEERAKKSWTQLDKAEQFIDKMKQQTFRLIGDNDDEDILPRSTGYTMSSQRKGPAGGNRRTKDTDKYRGSMEPGRGISGAVGSHGTSRQTGGAEESTLQATPTNNRVLRSSPSLPDDKQLDGSTTAKHYTPHIFSSDPVEIRGDQRPKKKRRSGPEALESNLGKNWEPRVDAEGHRPTRNKSKKP